MSSVRSGCLAGALLALATCATTEPMQPADESLLVTLASLSQFGLELPAGYEEHQAFRREGTTGGTVTIEYEFAAPDGGPPVVYASVELHPSQRDACLSYSAGNVGIRLSALELSERNDLFAYGDKSRFALIESDGEPVGNVFAMCRSRTAMLVLFVGIYFDDADAWRALIEPRLEALAALAAQPPR
jgi:hypothetical protein